MRAGIHPIVRHVLLAAALLGAVPLGASAQSAKARYDSALSREPEVHRLIKATDADDKGVERVLERTRQLASRYEIVARRYPRSGYSDNALARAAALRQVLYDRYGHREDRDKAVEYYRWVAKEYPSSSLVKDAKQQVAVLTAPPKPVRPTPAPRKAVAAASTRAAEPRRDGTAAQTDDPSAAPVRLTDIERTVLPEAVRITLALDSEVSYHEETLQGPDRVFFDLQGVSTTDDLRDAVLSFPDDVVREIRLGRHPNDTVRVVLDAEGVTSHSVFTLYNPFRIVIDCERPEALAAVPRAPERRTVADDAPLKLAREADLPPDTPVPARKPAVVPTAPPATPPANSAGGFSLSRQLGLGVSRIVIDPGHGGHDPGTNSRGLHEKDLTLDIALRLEKLLKKEKGVDVVLTRRTDVYVPLEERTAIANREDADLFLSIHANASRNASAGGIETYYLSFASSPDAEEVAARENSASGRDMHHLPDIIKAIALNNKLDESHDFASMVQDSLVSRMRRTHKALPDRGVKKAPFVVLIGASMPSVLAEISFLTNKRENQLLRTDAYKNRIAEALHTAVMQYRHLLKRQSTVAEQD